MLTFGLIVLAGTALFLVGCQTTRAGYESAPYQTVRTDGDFALRDYPVLTVVETPMLTAGREDDGSFNRLFRFITGRNDSGQKIAMTTPVFMAGEDQSRTMAFVLPANLKAATAPRPTDDAVKVQELPAGRFAVLRFTGSRRAATEAEALTRLRAWLEPQALRAVSPPVFAYFDPPWTPTFLRRNEVMLRVEPRP